MRSAGTPCRCPIGGRYAGLSTRTGSTIPQDLALVGLQDSVDDLDQGAFSGAVLAQQGMDLTRPDRKADPIVGDDALEAFADVLES